MILTWRGNLISEGVWGIKIFTRGRVTRGFKSAKIVTDQTQIGRSGVVRAQSASVLCLQIHLPEHRLEWYQETSNSWNSYFLSLFWPGSGSCFGFQSWPQWNDSEASSVTATHSNAKQLCTVIREERAEELSRAGMENNAARKRHAMATLKRALAKQWENGGDAGISRLTSMEGIWTILCTILIYYWQFCEQLCVQFCFWYCSILLRIVCEILWTISNNYLYNFVQFCTISRNSMDNIVVYNIEQYWIFRAI